MLRLAPSLFFTVLIQLLFSCKGTSTQDLLDAVFITSRKLSIVIANDTIYDGKIFVARLEGRATPESGILQTMKGPVTWKLTGGGTLTLVSCPAMVAGVQSCTMRYDGGLVTGQTKVIKLQATHVESGETVSDGFTVATQAFSVSVPARINANTTFTATVTAIDPFGGTNTSYSGTVIPYLGLMPGRPNIEEISNFVNGVATVQMQIHKPAWQMQLVVYDKANANSTGTSNTFRVIQTDANYVALDLTAIPRTATENRLSWTSLDATVVNAYKIYRKDANGNYVLIFTEPTVANTYYNDTGLTTGQNYDYKMEALDSAGNILSTDFASSTPKACTVVTASPTVSTIWTKAQSPYCGSIAISLTSPLIIEPGVVILWNGGGNWTGGGQIIQANGTPRDRIIFTSSAAVPAAGHFPGFGVTSLYSTVLDASGNFSSGSIFKNVVIEYGGGAYWLSSNYVYQSFIYRYNGATLFLFENSNTIISGGVYARNATPIAFKGAQTSQLTNFILYRNVNTTSYGGAFYMKVDSNSSAYNLKITGNYFLRNTAVNGNTSSGGLTIDPDGTSPATVGGPFQISDNFFLNNTNQTTAYNGGAIRLASTGAPTYNISNNTFSGNSATNGAAVSLDGGSMTSPIFNNNYFVGNSATTNGGAIRIASGTAVLTATNNQFVSNTATAGRNFFNGIAQSHNLQFSYWDGATDTTCAAPQRLALGISDGCPAVSAMNVVVTGATATQYSLCINDPTVTNCVGAR